MNYKTLKKGIKIMKKTIVTVAGRTAAGKSVIAKKLAQKLGLKVLKSYTTRPPRPEEVENPEQSDHIFISNEEYDKLEDIAAETTINGNRYCTTINLLKDCDFYIIDPLGIKYLKEKCGKDFRFVQFYIYAGEDHRRLRFTARSKDTKEFEERNRAEAAQFDDYEKNHEYDIIIYNNGNVDDAVDVMDSYVTIALKERLQEIEEKKSHTDIEEISSDKKSAENTSSIQSKDEDEELSEMECNDETTDKDASDIGAAVSLDSNTTDTEVFSPSSLIEEVVKPSVVIPCETVSPGLGDMATTEISEGEEPAEVSVDIEPKFNLEGFNAANSSLLEEDSQDDKTTAESEGHDAEDIPVNVGLPNCAGNMPAEEDAILID